MTAPLATAPPIVCFSHLCWDFVYQRPQPLLRSPTPMAQVLSDPLAASAVVYDCMDELSQFLHAPAELLPRERALLARADAWLHQRSWGRNVHEVQGLIEACTVVDDALPELV